jgi:hypothetical protein
MNLSGGSATGTAGAVWTNPTRTLTGIGGNALSFFNVTRRSLAASAGIFYRPTPTQGWFLTIAVTTGTAGSALIELADGSNITILSTIAAGTSGGASMNVTNTNYLQILNQDATNSMFLAVAAIVLQQ